MPDDPTFHDGLSEDLRGNDALKDFTSLDGLAKSYIDTKAKVGGMVTIPDERSNDESRVAFYTKLGRPEKVDGYEFEKTEIKGFKYDDKSIDGFRAMSHSTNLTGQQAKDVFNWLMADTSTKLVGAIKDHQDGLDAAEAKLKTEWGADFEKNEGAMEKALGQFFNEEDHQTIATLVLQNPMLANGFAEIGLKMGENSTGGDTQDGDTKAVTKEEAIAKIKMHMNDEKGAYRNRDHPDHRETVEEIRKLYVVAYDNVEVSGS